MRQDDTATPKADSTLTTGTVTLAANKSVTPSDEDEDTITFTGGTATDAFVNVAVTDGKATISNIAAGDAFSIGEKEFGIYLVKMNVWTEDGDVFVRYDFNRSEFPFGFPPAHFATSYSMKIENTSNGSGSE